MESPFVGSTKEFWWAEALQLSVASLSLLLNGFLLISNFRRTEGRWATDGILIAITAILDSIQGSYLICNTLARMIHPSIVYDGSPWCKVTFVVGRAIGVACLDIVAILSLVRYLVIVLGHDSHPRRWSCAAVGLCCFLLGAFGLRAKYSTLYVYPSKIYCNPVGIDKNFISPILSYLLVAFSLPPLFVIPFCYARVTFFYSRLVTNLYGDELSQRGKIQDKISGIILVVVAYWVVVVPDYILFFAFRIFRIKPTPVIDSIVCILASCVGLLNAIFPLTFHQEIKQEATSILSRQRRKLRFVDA